MNNDPSHKPNAVDGSEKDLPGYPHYPASEDITRAGNNAGKVSTASGAIDDEENTIDLPEVKDIPGQEHVVPPRLGYLADGTAASDDEEGMQDGEDLLSREDQEDDAAIVMGTEADIPAEDLQMLRAGDSAMDTKDDNSLQRARLDEIDDDGDPLNEAGFDKTKTGRDLDVPGEEQDGSEQASGEEDEENDYYSLGGDEKNSLDEDPNDGL